MAYKIFISASHEDRDLARDLARRLEEAGVKVYLDNKAIAGERWHAGISRDFSNADEIVLILTSASLSSPHLMYDMGAAASLRKPVTLIGIGLEKKDNSLLIQGTRYVKYPDLPKYISELKRRTKAA